MAIMMKILVNNGIWGHPIFRGSGNWKILPYTDWMRCTTLWVKKCGERRVVEVAASFAPAIQQCSTLSSNMIWFRGSSTIFDNENRVTCCCPAKMYGRAGALNRLPWFVHTLVHITASFVHTLVDFVSKAKEQAHNALVFHGCCGRWLSWARHLLKVLFCDESRKEWKMDPTCSAGLPFQSKNQQCNCYWLCHVDAVWPCVAQRALCAACLPRCHTSDWG